MTKRDQEILETLTLKVRFLSISQIARTWWQGTANAQANARERLKLLEQVELIVGFTAMAHPELSLTFPIVVWEPGETFPDFGAVSYRLKTRWIEPPIAVDVNMGYTSGEFRASTQPQSIE